ncbi:sugar transferase [Geodermatophilus sp. SYSU D00684]
MALPGRPGGLRSPGPSPLAKAVLDRLLATLLLACTAPWIALVALLVWSTEDGPVLVRDRRVGQGGRPFTLLRLRTPAWTHAGRSRVGAVLRWTNLADLLQLVNVLRGEMSLVGPRPATGPRPDAVVRGRLKPGLVGLRALGRADEDETDLSERYAREWTPWLDLRILWRSLLGAGTRPVA